MRRPSSLAAEPGHLEVAPSPHPLLGTLVVAGALALALGLQGCAVRAQQDPSRGEAHWICDYHALSDPARLPEDWEEQLAALGRADGAIEGGGR